MCFIEKWRGDFSLPIIKPGDINYTLEKVGRKAFNIQMLKQANIPTLDGIVLKLPLTEIELIDAWDVFDHPKNLAVRSSMLNEDGDKTSLAGKFDTVLGVKNFDDFKSSVKKVIESANNPSLVSVFVQPMSDNAISGVLFSRTKSNEDEVYIEACYGLGEILVSGLVVPDRFIIQTKTDEIKAFINDKKSFGIFLETENLKEGQEKSYLFGDIRKTVSMGKGKFLGSIRYQERNRAVLTDEQLIQLAQMAKSVEAFFDYPQDIEFGINENNMVVLQTRPVTSLFNPSLNNKRIQNKDTSLVGLSASDGLIRGKVIKDFSKANDPEENYIYVGFETKPELLYELGKVKGIITESGGLLCHASIVSRELNIPCLVGVDGATDLLHDEMEIVLDATNGVVTIMKGVEDVE